jgi:hypothetical protein
MAKSESRPDAQRAYRERKEKRAAAIVAALKSLLAVVEPDELQEVLADYYRNLPAAE